MTRADLAAWALAFVLTQLIEVPLYLRFLRHSGRPRREQIAIALGASAITHPLIWFVGPVLLGPNLAYPVFLGILETFVVVIEALWLVAFRVPRAIVASLVVNAVSAAVGVALRWVLDFV